jgi:hypothetical protein
MIVLAYLISAPLSARQDVSAQDRPNRILLGLRKTDEGDEEHLRRFSEILLDLGKGEHSARPRHFVWTLITVFRGNLRRFTQTSSV